MTDPLEQLILQGGLGDHSDGLGPERRAHGKPSTPPELNTDDELGSDLDSSSSHPTLAASLSASKDAEKDIAGIEAIRSSQPQQSKRGPSNRTGPKGVIRDREIQSTLDRRMRNARVDAVNKGLKKVALSTNTWDEDLAMREVDKRAGDKQQSESADGRKDSTNETMAAIEDLRARERRRENRLQELQAQAASRGLGGGGKLVRGPTTWFGHLREVDAMGYADAIDRTEEDVWVVIHLYSKLAVACAQLSSALKSIARQYPHIKFLQVRAISIGFGSSSFQQQGEEDEDESESDKILREAAAEEEAVDVLPTILVYRSGQLVHNLVRVDLDPRWRKGEERDVLDLFETLGLLEEDNDERILYDSDAEESEED